MSQSTTPKKIPAQITNQKCHISLERATLGPQRCWGSLVERKLPKYSNLFDTSTPETQRFGSETFSLKESQFLFKLKHSQCDIAPHQGFARPPPPETRRFALCAFLRRQDPVIYTATVLFPQFGYERNLDPAVRRCHLLSHIGLRHHMPRPTSQLTPRSS